MFPDGCKDIPRQAACFRGDIAAKTGSNGGLAQGARPGVAGGGSGRGRAAPCKDQSGLGRSAPSALALWQTRVQTSSGRAMPSAWLRSSALRARSPGMRT